MPTNTRTEFTQLTAYMFVHHFLTHSTVWDVYGSDYDSIDDVPEKNRQFFFEDAHGNIFMSQGPVMMRRDQADAYTRDADDSAYWRYEVIEIS